MSCVRAGGFESRELEKAKRMLPGPHMVYTLTTRAGS